MSMLRPVMLAAGLASLAIATSLSASPSWRPAPSPMSTATLAELPAGQAIADDELKSFAAASLRVEAINRRWQSQIADADSRADEAKMREQAAAEMVQAVQERGLSVERYNRIALAVQSDPEIARTVQAYRVQQP